ncbi:MAG: transposase [Christensenellaceae bacterium]|nr:transposase [Christensenellaceae bacterium]
MQLQQLKEIFEYIYPSYKITLSSGINTDHVHMLLSAETKTEICKCINAYKSASSRIVKPKFLKFLAYTNDN